MGCLLVVCAVGLAFLDLFLFAQVWEIWGFPWAFALLIVPPCLGLRLIRRQRKMIDASMEGGLGAGLSPGSLLLEVMLLNVAKVLFLWPGPLSTLLAILLLLPLFRTLLIRWVILRWMGQFFKATMSGPAPGVQIHFGSHWASNWGTGPSKDGLKTVQGEDLGSQPLDRHELDQSQE